MLTVERQDKILALLKEKTIVKIQELVDETGCFGVYDSKRFNRT